LIEGVNLKKKLLIAAAIATLFTNPVEASNEITLPEGTENQLSSAINRGTINAEKQFNYIHYLGEYMPPNYCISYYAMASLVKDTGKYAKLNAHIPGNYIDLTNDGIINLHSKDIIREYESQLDIAEDTSRKYDAFIGWGMLAGKNSKIVNNGEINMFFDHTNTNANYTVMIRPMYANEYSSMINNGKITATGKGSLGAEVRGITTGHGHMTVENNGLIYLDVEKSFLSRAFLSLGDGGRVVNSGTIYNKSSCTAFGMLATTGTDLLNSGKVTVISSGQNPAKVPGFHSDFAVERTGAYGMTSSPKKSGGDGRILNTGKLIVQIQGNKNSSPIAVAAGMMVMNARNDSEVLTLENTGVIEVSSNIKPSKENNYLVRSSEIAINSLMEKWGNSNVAILNWATPLRDFGATKNFIQAQNCSIDFSNTNFILREDKNYKLGTVYKISPETLIAPLAGKTLADSKIVVTGFNSITFSAENPKLKVSASKNSDGSYNVSLISK
jgi:hypothetical protein